MGGRADGLVASGRPAWLAHARMVLAQGGGTAMTGIWSLNLIHFLDFYFALMFFSGLVRRFGQYQAVGRLLVAGPGRWPNLLKLVHQYRTIFWTWSMLLPALLTLGLWIAQMVASRLL